MASFFFLAFRTGAFLTCLLGSFFSNNFTLIFVLVILQLAFWTTKNVSGRLLVGLRWWNEIQLDGSNKWVFESAHVKFINKFVIYRKYSNQLKYYSRIEIQIVQIHCCFGRSYMVHLYFGGIFAFSCILTMKAFWLCVVVIAIVMNAANVYEFSQCNKDAKRGWTTNLVTQSALESLGVALQVC